MSVQIEAPAGSSNGHHSENREVDKLVEYVITDLLSSSPRFDYNIIDTGDCAPALSILVRTRQGCTDVRIVQKALDSLKAKKDSPLGRFFQTKESKEAEEKPLGIDENGWPQLPDHVKANQELADKASPILDAMIRFFRYWATRSYDGYHETVAIWVLTTIAARRIVLKWRNGVWPVLYFMLVSESGAHAKTDAASYGQTILQSCGLDHLLTPDDISPQKLLSNMSGSTVPRNYSCMTPEQRAKFTEKIAFCGQRGWAFDEFGNKLQEIVNAKGGYNAMFYALLKKLYDCKPQYEYDTFAHDTLHIDMPSLSILGTATPSCLAPIARKNSPAWSDGTLARISFSVPPKGSYKLESAPQGSVVVPTEIINAMTEWHKRLGIPSCQIVDVQEEEAMREEAYGKTQKKRGSDGPQYRVERGELPQNEVLFTDKVFHANALYYETLVKLAMENNLDERFKSTYVRLAERALRIAILLASLEGKGQSRPTIEMRHWARGQEIAEHWRKDFHELVAQLSIDEPEGYGETEEKVLKAIAKLGRMANCREISQAGSTSLRTVGTPKVREVCEELAAAGTIAVDGHGKKAKFGPLGEAK